MILKKGKMLYLGIGAVVLIIIISVISSLSAVEVDTIKVSKGDINRTVSETGTVNSASESELYTVSGGRIETLPVKIGQKVNKGEIIAALTNAEISLQLSSLKAHLAQAKTGEATIQGLLITLEADQESAQKHLNRMEELYNAKAISKAEYERSVNDFNKINNSIESHIKQLTTSREQITMLQSSIGELENKSNELMISSPFEGKIINLPIKENQIVMPGSLIATIVADSNVEIKADILADDLGQVNLGQKVEITAPVLGDKKLWGEIIDIYPRAEEKISTLGVVQRRVPVIISLDNPDILKPGYETRINIYTEIKENVIIIPREVVINNVDTKQVRVIVNNRVEYRDIATGLYDTKNIEIISGLSEGDLIIKNTRIDLKPNSKVKIK